MTDAAGRADAEPDQPAPHESAADGDAAAAPSASELVGQALGSAARRAGLDPDQDAPTGQIVWQVIGGWRGILESVLPLLAFIVTYTVTRQLLLSLALSVGAAAVFTIIRLVMKSPPVAALSGLVAAVVAAGLPLFTGRAEDQFVIGFITNIAYGSAFLVSALVRWPLIGLVVGFLTGEGLAWREDRRKRRLFFWLSVAWAALFLIRLGAQLPFYLAGDVTTLGTLKLAMGIPFFAVLLATTWILVRRLYPGAPKGEDAAQA